MKKKLFLLFFITSTCFASIKAQNGDEEEMPANCWRWEQMMPDDLLEAIDKVPVCYLVVSPLEWHAEAMSFGTDIII